MPATIFFFKWRRCRKWMYWLRCSDLFFFIWGTCEREEEILLHKSWKGQKENYPHSHFHFAFDIGSLSLPLSSSLFLTLSNTQLISLSFSHARTHSISISFPISFSHTHTSSLSHANTSSFPLSLTRTLFFSHFAHTHLTDRQTPTRRTLVVMSKNRGRRFFSETCLVTRKLKISVQPS